MFWISHRKADAHLAIAQTSVHWKWFQIGLYHLLIGFRTCNIWACCCFVDPRISLMILGFFLTAFHATLGIVTQSQWKILPSYQDTKQKPRDFSDHDGYGSIWNLFFFGPLDWNHCIDWNQRNRNQHQNRDTGRFWLFHGFSQPQPKCGWFFFKSFSLWNLEGNPLKDTPRNLRPDSFDDWRWLFLLCRDPSQS